jgi:hypothetical protein
MQQDLVLSSALVVTAANGQQQVRWQGVPSL